MFTDSLTGYLLHVKLKNKEESTSKIWVITSKSFLDHSKLLEKSSTRLIQYIIMI